MIQHQEIESEEAFYDEVFWDWNDDLDRVTDHALGMVEYLAKQRVKND